MVRPDDWLYTKDPSGRLPKQKANEIADLGCIVESGYGCESPHLYLKQML
jgi:hypothetical protein